METHDRQLIHRMMKDNSLIRRLYSEHLELEDKLSQYENRGFLTTIEEMEVKRLKSQKLAGMDHIMQLLAEHRGEGGTQEAAA